MTLSLHKNKPNFTRSYQYQRDKMTFQEKLDKLNRLPKHKMTYMSGGSEGNRMGIRKWFDIGTLRPWGVDSLKFLFNEIKAGSDAMHIAFLARRCYFDTFAMVKICQWMMKEVGEDGLLEMQGDVEL
jgi:hypothetical protein|tara:strand:- start:99 stop:479 length:381 start_codon:yes stop_codon:yes gene_type:complete